MMTNSLFLILLIHFSFKLVLSEFSYIKELEKSSISENLHLENKLSDIYAHYKNIAHTTHLGPKDTALIEQFKKDVNNILPNNNKQLVKNIGTSFIQQQVDEADNDNPNKGFHYQPFTQTRFYTKNTPPSKRKGHTTIIADTFLMVFGGCYQEIKCYNDLYFLDLRSHKWIEIPTLGQKPGPRGGHSAILYGTTLWVFAGNTNEGYLNDVFSLNLETREWKQEYLNGDTPTPRTNLNGVKDDQGRMIVFGGYTETGYDNTLYVLDFNNMVFEKPQVSGNIPSKRENYGMVYLNNRVWLFGGFQEGGVLSDLYSIDTITWTWTIVETSGPKPPASQGMSMSRVGKKIFVTGGCDVRKKKCFSDTYVLDTDSLWWTKIINNKSQMQPRESFTSVYFRGHLYSFGGCQLHMFCFNDVFIMNVDDNCPNKCSGNGICKKELGCACKIGFSEHDCSIKTKCRHDCSGHGFCHNNAKCGCFPGFTGPYCEVNLNCPSNCTSLDHGYCANNGTCVCKEGFTGPACDQLSSCDVVYVPAGTDIKKLDLDHLKNITAASNVTTNNKSNITSGNTTKKHQDEASRLKKRLLQFDRNAKNSSNISWTPCGDKKNSSNITKLEHMINEHKKKIKSNKMRITVPVFLQTKRIEKDILEDKMKIRNNITLNFSTIKIDPKMRKSLAPKSDDDDTPTKKTNSSSKNASSSDDEDDLLTKKKKSKSTQESDTSFITGVDTGKLWVMNNGCPNNCSERGVCLNSTCFCDQGYTWDDCSLTYKAFTLVGYKFQDMMFALVVAFVLGMLIMGIYSFLNKGKSTDGYLDLE